VKAALLRNLPDRGLIMLARGLTRTLLLICAIALGSGCVFAKSSVPAKRTATKQVSSGKHPRYKRWSKRRSWKSRGQQVIDKQRAREIQLALIRGNYLQGEPSGVWDSRTRQALQRFQADRGWQTKIVPDSRALIELGLGPKHENIINPETAMTPAALAGAAAANNAATSGKQ
jgi:peptidoglycan hydrolase-like protein with peptidoglycan-binding domain